MSKGETETVTEVQPTIPDQFTDVIFGQQPTFEVDPETGQKTAGVTPGGVIPTAEDLFREGGFAPIREPGDILQEALGQGTGGLEDFAGQTQDIFSQLAGIDLTTPQLPELDPQVAENLIQRSTANITENLRRSTIPGIGDAAIQAGQLGSSRQGVAEGVAAAEAQRNISDVTANILASQQAAEQQRALAQAGIDLNVQGQRQSALTSALGLAPQITSVLNQPLQRLLTLGQIQQGFEDEAGQAQLNNLIRFGNFIRAFIPGAAQQQTQTVNDPNALTRNLIGGGLTAAGLLIPGKAA